MSSYCLQWPPWRRLATSPQSLRGSGHPPAKHWLWLEVACWLIRDLYSATELARAQNLSVLFAKTAPEPSTMPGTQRPECARNKWILEEAKERKSCQQRRAWRKRGTYKNEREIKGSNQASVSQWNGGTDEGHWVWGRILGVSLACWTLVRSLWHMQVEMTTRKLEISVGKEGKVKREPWESYQQRLKSGYAGVGELLTEGR